MSQDKHTGTGWCTAIFRILAASHATDTAIRDAVEYFLKTRRENRGF